MRRKGITAKEIIEWDDAQSSFSLEMRSFQHLISNGYEAEHGGTYSDPVTGKPRQFDIRCKMRKRNRIVKLAIECKALSKDFPLVVQRVPRLRKESFHEIFLAYEPLPPLPFPNSKVMRTESVSVLYPIGDYVGKSLTQVGERNGKIVGSSSEIYDKWAQAISSAYDLVVDCTTEREDMRIKELYAVILPMVVVSDECLWHVDYGINGERISEPENCDEIDFYISKDFWCKGQMCATYTASHIKLLTYTGYKTFIEKLARWEHFWNLIFPVEF